jgi:hypothetical protein
MRGVGKQNTTPKDHSKHLILLRKYGLARGFGSSTLTFGKVVLPAAKEDQSRNLRLPHPRHATMATGERLAGERLRLLRTPNPSFNLDHGALGRRQRGLKKAARLLSRAARGKPRCDAEGVAPVACAAHRAPRSAFERARRHSHERITILFIHPRLRFFPAGPRSS